MGRGTLPTRCPSACAPTVSPTSRTRRRARGNGVGFPGGLAAPRSRPTDGRWRHLQRTGAQERTRPPARSLLPGGSGPPPGLRPQQTRQALGFASVCAPTAYSNFPDPGSGGPVAAGTANQAYAARRPPRRPPSSTPSLSAAAPGHQSAAPREGPLHRVRVKLERRRGHSSAGRAPALQAGGHRFDPGWLRFRKSVATTATSRPLLDGRCVNQCAGHHSWASNERWNRRGSNPFGGV